MLKCSTGVIALMRITHVNWLHGHIMLRQEKVAKHFANKEVQTWVLEACGKIGSLECFCTDGRLVFSEPIPIEEFSKDPDFAFTKLTVFVQNKSLVLGYELEKP